MSPRTRLALFAALATALTSTALAAVYVDHAWLWPTVGAIMTEVVETCAPTDTLDALMEVMTMRRFRHVPVVKDGKLVGIVSIGDVVKHKLSQLEFERDQLDSYVHQT